jgi:hypothetical protein
MEQKQTLLSNLVPVTSLSPDSSEVKDLYESFTANLAGPQFTQLNAALTELLKCFRFDRKKIVGVRDKLLDIRKTLKDCPETFLSVQFKTDVEASFARFEQENRAAEEHSAHKQTLQTLSSSLMALTDPSALATTLQDVHTHVVRYGEDRLRHEIRTVLMGIVVPTLPILVIIRNLADCSLPFRDPFLMFYVNHQGNPNYSAVLEESVADVTQYVPFGSLVSIFRSTTVTAADKQKAAYDHIQSSMLAVQYRMQGHWTIMASLHNGTPSQFAQDFDVLKGQRSDCVFEL